MGSKLKEVIKYFFLMFITCSSFSALATNEIYHIGCDIDYKPFSWYEDGECKGIEVDILKNIAREENISFVLVPLNFGEIMSKLIEKEIDGAIAGINLTEERKHFFDFSVGYYESGLSLIIREDEIVRRLDSLYGKRAVVKKGSTGALFVEDHLDVLGSKILYVTSSSEIFDAIRNHKADYTIDDYPVVNYQITNGIQKGVKIAIKSIAGSPKHGFTVLKGTHKELIRLFDEGLYKIKDNGIYDLILKKYQ